jgi:UDP-N-acetylglucosamine 1-carboxyvinyltransferase
MSYRNEAVSYACMAIATKGDIIVEGARPEFLTAFLSKLDEVGGKYEIADYGIRFYYDKPLVACDVITRLSQVS